MIINSVIASLHFIAAFGVVFSVVFEWLTFSRSPSLLDAKRIQKADIIYGISAALVLIFGFLRLIYFEKGSEFYYQSPFYFIKLYTFAAVGILSIYPTICFLRWRKKTKLNTTPTLTEKEFQRISWILRVEILGLVAMVFAASLMAKGVDW